MYYQWKVMDMVTADGMNSLHIQVCYKELTFTMSEGMPVHSFDQPTPWSKPFLRSCQSLRYSRMSRHFMEPVGSLLIPILSQIFPVLTAPSQVT
jgi:hypothetical protein